MKIIQRISETWLLGTVACVDRAASAIGAFNLAFSTNDSVAYTYAAFGRITTASYDIGVCIIYSHDPQR